MEIIFNFTKEVEIPKDNGKSIVKLENEVDTTLPLLASLNSKYLFSLEKNVLMPFELKISHCYDG